MANLSFVAQDLPADRATGPRILVVSAICMLVAAGGIFALNGGGWLPAAMLPLVGIAGASLTRLLTRSMLEACGFLAQLSVYLLFAALFNVINLHAFGTLFEEGDSQGYYDIATGLYGAIKLDPIGIFINGRLVLDSTLSIVTYQRVYDFTRLLGAPDAAWQILLTNALLISLALVLVLRSARLCFPNSRAATVAAGTIFMTCPLMLLYVVEPLRDSFSVAMVSALLYAAARLAAQPSWQRGIVFALAAGLFSYLISFLRLQFLFIAPMITLALLIAGICYGRRSPGRALLLASGGAAFVAILIAILPALLETAATIQAYAEIYSKQAVEHGEGEGLGYFLVVSLPLPLRMLAGAFIMHINPIPLWIFIDPTGMPARSLYSFNGIWAILLVPPAFAGLSVLFSKKCPDAVSKAAVAVAALTYFGALGAVSLTSMEIRHLSAFYPAFCILAAAPFAVGKPILPLLRTTARTWLFVVILVHLMWGVLKLVV